MTDSPMKRKLLSLAVLIALLPHRLAPLRALRSLRLNPGRVVLANIAEGQHLASQGITLEADVAITERNLLMKRGGAANRVAICGVANLRVGGRKSANM